MINTKDINEMTALHYCARSGAVQFLERLLQLGASATETEERDRTPIHVAAEYD